MVKKLLLLSLFLSIFLVSYAQQPAKTVTFKVRKSKVVPLEEVVMAERTDEIVEADEPAFVIVEENASFQGGDLNSFRLWVQKQIVFPTDVAEAGISGKVILQFAVNSKGAVVDAKVLRGVNPTLDKEAVKAIMSSPKWVAGRQGGKSIKQQFVMPVVFQLQ